MGGHLRAECMPRTPSKTSACHPSGDCTVISSPQIYHKSGKTITILSDALSPENSYKFNMNILTT